MRKMIIISIILFVAAFALLTFLFSKAIEAGRTKLVEHYQKDDTTIICKNGKCDTTIVKGKTPDLLK